VLLLAVAGPILARFVGARGVSVTRQ
jgi:hypothetical protein